MAKKLTLEWSDITGRATWHMAHRLAMHHGKGYRMPTVAEVVSCFDYFSGKTLPGFEDFADKLVWTSTNFAGDTNQSYHVNMKNGLVNYSRNDNQHFVVYVKDIEVDDGYGEEIEIISTDEQITEINKIDENGKLREDIADEMVDLIGGILTGKIEASDKVKTLLGMNKPKRGRPRKKKEEPNV